jgi:3D (Asp-Asp-Asp) domain-containing protein
VLWEAGIRVEPEDRLEPPASTPLTGPIQASLRRAAPLAILLQGQVLPVRSVADTVGDALAAAGLALQGLDYAVPEEGAPVPLDGQIRVVRVRETAVLEQVQLPFDSEYQADPETELDQKRILQAGEFGLRVSRVRVRTEDGTEVARKQEGEWVAREPRTQLVGFGTRAVVHTETVDGVTIEYWRKVTAYATSYTACSAGSCDGRTASGAPVTKGVAAVIRSWYNQLRGQQVYVPGYGTATIADIGGGVPGQNWIDLGYSEGDYVPWHSTVTIYFLAPVPANVPWNLP